MQINKISLITGLAMTGIPLMGSFTPAQAIILNVGGQNYNITTFLGSYNNQTAKFEVAANGGVMPWWGNQALANNFATTVGAQLGLPNDVSGFYGPLFAFSYKPGSISVVWTEASFQGTSAPTMIISGVSEQITYAQATAVPWETDALPIVGSSILLLGGILLKGKLGRSRSV